MSIELASILFSAAMIAGVVDSIAGGGGLITVPVLLSIGLSPAQALATNKLQAVGGSFSASLYFLSRGLVKLQDLKLAIMLSFLSSAMGTLLVQTIDPYLLTYLIPFLLIGIACYFMFAPNIGDEDSQQRISMLLFSCSAAILIGFYDGFLGPGTGSFFTLAFVSLLGYSLTRATAHAKVLNCTTNVASLLFFILGGKMVWSVGGIMIIGQFLGARLGSALVFVNGKKIIRPMIVVVSLTVTIKLLCDRYGLSFF